MKTAILTLILSFALIPLCFTVTDEQIKKYLYKNERKLTHNYTLDYEEFCFHYDESQQWYDLVDYDGAGEREMDKGAFTIKDGKIYLESNSGTTSEAKLEGIDQEVPYIDYQCKLVINSRGEYYGPAPENGEKVHYHGVPFIKDRFTFVTDKVYITYTEPDENADFYISNRIYKNAYKDMGSYRIMPGIAMLALGKYGNWILVVDNFRNLYKHDYAWIHVDDATKITEFKSDEHYSQLDVVKGYEDLFDESAYLLTPLTQEEIAKISDKKGYEMFYDYSCVTDDKDYETKMTGLEANTSKTLSDNLRLRSSSDLNSQIVTTAKKGATVQILETGKRDVIDCIYSRWVKVEVINGTDKDGKKLPAKTTGWCFGGYLE